MLKSDVNCIQMRSSLLFVIFIFTLISSLSAQFETRELPSFNSVYATQGIRVFLIQGEKETAKIVVKGGDRSVDLKHILTEVRAGELNVAFGEKSIWEYNTVLVDVFVTFKEINQLKVGSSATVKGKEVIKAAGNFKFEVADEGNLFATLVGVDQLEINASGSSSIEVTVETNDIAARISDSAKVVVSGFTGSQDIVAIGAANYKASELISEDAIVYASKKASVHVNVNKKLEAYASEWGKVAYEGTPSYFYANAETGGSVMDPATEE